MDPAEKIATALTQELFSAFERYRVVVKASHRADSLTALDALEEDVRACVLKALVTVNVAFAEKLSETL